MTRLARLVAEQKRHHSARNDAARRYVDGHAQAAAWREADFDAPGASDAGYDGFAVEVLR